jgi:hypothetical protein
MGAVKWTNILGITDPKIELVAISYTPEADMISYDSFVGADSHKTVHCVEELHTQEITVIVCLM